MEEIRIYPILGKEEDLKQLESKLQKKEARINKLKEEGKPISLGLKVGYNALQQSISRLKEDTAEPLVNLTMESKYIKKIDIRFRGAGIIEQDEYGDQIKRRVVRLLRVEYAEGSI